MHGLASIAAVHHGDRAQVRPLTYRMGTEANCDWLGLIDHFRTLGFAIVVHDSVYDSVYDDAGFVPIATRFTTRSRT